MTLTAMLTNGYRITSHDTTRHDRDSVDITTLLRHGYFAMYPDFATIKTVLPQVIKKASASLILGPIEALNVLHIGFATHLNDEVTYPTQLNSLKTCGEYCVHNHITY